MEGGSALAQPTPGSFPEWLEFTFEAFSGLSGPCTQLPGFPISRLRHPETKGTPAERDLPVLQPFPSLSK